MTLQPTHIHDTLPRGTLDLWRREYNDGRLHEALRLPRPAAGDVTSLRKYPRPLVQHEYDPFSHVTRIDKNGLIKWHNRQVFICSALKHEYIEFDAGLRDGRWNVR